MKKLLGSAILLIGIAIVIVTGVIPPYVDADQNRNLTPGPYEPPEAVREFHASMTIMDWHADTLLWNRDLLSEYERGHVDVPRLQRGNVALQMFTVVSRAPKGQNYVSTEDKNDLVTPLVIAQRWPVATWTSAKARAVYQAEKLDKAVNQSWRKLRWVRDQGELNYLLRERAKAVESGYAPPVGALLGMEGAQTLEGDIGNLEEFYELGYRMIGLTHFFDNELGGSLHGVEKGGLTELGRQFVERANQLGILIDISHASEQTVRDVLALSTKPLVMSHGGMKGACDSPRNIPDELMQEIAARGGLLAMGFWDGAICDPSAAGIAKMIEYAADTVGVDHVALGSDWDGSVTTMDADNVASITAALIDLGMSREDIAKVMGGNSVAFLQRWLPEDS